MIRALPLLLFAVSIASASTCVAAERPNVLFIAIDDLKPTLGCYGDSIAITPAIDQLASQGTVFANSHCQWPVCGPSRASLMSSLRPESNGVMNLSTDIRQKNRDLVTLPQYFKQHGYTTAGVGKIYDPRCVDNKQDQDAPSWSVPYTRLPYAKIEFGKVDDAYLAPDVDGAVLTDGHIARLGIELLRDLHGKKQPFFLAIGFKKPHLPFVAPIKYWDMYDPSQFRLAKHQGGIQNDAEYSLHDSSEIRGYRGIADKGPLPEQTQRKAIHGYYACTSYVDSLVGDLLAELKSLGLDDNTIVVLWGDHGFHLGDHGMWGKHSTLENATRSPLIIRPVGGSKVSLTNAPVEFTDIYPTLCELAQLPSPSHIEGRSIGPILSGQSAHVRQGALTVFKSRGSIGYSYRTERYRYTEWVNKHGKSVAFELYDYQTDPLETSNLAGDAKYATIRADLAAALRRESQGCERLLIQSK